jgi:hypothetical protein
LLLEGEADEELDEPVLGDADRLRSLLFECFEDAVGELRKSVLKTSG